MNKYQVVRMSDMHAVVETITFEVVETARGFKVIKTMENHIARGLRKVFNTQAEAEKACLKHQQRTQEEYITMRTKRIQA